MHVVLPAHPSLSTMSGTPQNANPTVHEPVAKRRRPSLPTYGPEPVDALEVFEFIRRINDPEHPLTLEQLKVLCLEDVFVDNANNKVRVEFTPTIPHCSMATLIGLSIKIKLGRSLAPRFKIHVAIKQGTHDSEAAINKQLADKERIAAAGLSDDIQVSQPAPGCIHPPLPPSLPVGSYVMLYRPL